MAKLLFPLLIPVCIVTGCDVLRSQPTIPASLPAASQSVSTPQPLETGVQRIVITPASLDMVPGDRQTPSAAVHMANNEINANVTWTSSDDTVATVNRTTGEVSALRVGTVTLIASYIPAPGARQVVTVNIYADRSQFPPSPSPTPIPMPSPKGGIVPSPTPLLTPSTDSTTYEGEGSQGKVIGPMALKKGVLIVGLDSGGLSGQAGIQLFTAAGRYLMSEGNGENILAIPEDGDYLIKVRSGVGTKWRVVIHPQEARPSLGPSATPDPATELRYFSATMNGRVLVQGKTPDGAIAPLVGGTVSVIDDTGFVQFTSKVTDPTGVLNFGTSTKLTRSQFDTFVMGTGDATWTWSVQQPGYAPQSVPFSFRTQYKSYPTPSLTITLSPN